MAVILGLNCFKHDSAAALLVNGRLTGAAEEERFCRQKHFADYPRETIDYLLEEAGIAPGDIEHVAYYMKPDLVKKDNLIGSSHYIFKSGGVQFLLSQLNGTRRMARISDCFREHLGKDFRAEFHFIDHHLSHAVGGFFCSGYSKAAVLTMDGVGDRDTSILGSFTPDGYRIFTRSVFPHSPGIYYSAITRHLGFKPDDDEYKVMGLSSYGAPEFLDLFRQIIGCTDDGNIRVNTRMLNIWRGAHHAVFAPAVEKLIGPARLKGEEISSRHRNIACSAQRALEEAGLTLAKYLRQKSGLDHLVISGGVGLNCVMNGLIEKEAGFESIYPFPASHDGGTSIGAAVTVHRELYTDIPLVPPVSMYLGPSFSELQIETVLRQSRLSWKKPDNLTDRIAELVQEGKVVAIFHGRMEFGPRALGNRSILADPRREDMKDKVNSIVKHREAFRPFAPSCLAEYAEDYFHGCVRSEYMIKTYPVVKGREREIPAVTHVDGTSRVQTVSREMNSFYYGIIDCFRQRTGVPIVLNTSFNVRGEPIVRTPVDAIRCFYGTGIDALAIPPFLLEKQPGQT